MHVIVYLMCGPLPWQSSELGTIDGLADTKSGKSRVRQIELIKKTKIEASGEDLAARGGADMPDSVRKLIAELVGHPPSTTTPRLTPLLGAARALDALLVFPAFLCFDVPHRFCNLKSVVAV